MQFTPGRVSEWLDCGNKDSTVYTNQRILEFHKGKELCSKTYTSQNSVIIEPCFIGENVKIINSVVGPYVSIGNNSVIEDSVIRNSIIQTHTKVTCVNIHNSMLGNYVDYKHHRTELNIGDYNTHHVRE
jgi:glucose-1-phosphate thymidylyltransferase